ncbi:hypothetical protein PsYK624_085220 [Phanerochaete sordida]|uniref:Uncharacterized protein n=1 Tax=Phanerochaete sordida TaxID=48140 RepID=A0A9P3LF93_9APHY|nr:hypothetical protein PsYK624_085220 [Phanerochaete sordida]
MVYKILEEDSFRRLAVAPSTLGGDSAEAVSWREPVWRATCPRIQASSGLGLGQCQTQRRARRTGRCADSRRSDQTMDHRAWRRRIRHRGDRCRSSLGKVCITEHVRIYAPGHSAHCHISREHSVLLEGRVRDQRVFEVVSVER